MRKLRVIRISSTVLDQFKNDFSNCKNKSELIRDLIQQIPKTQSKLNFYPRRVKEALTQVPLYLNDQEYAELKENMKKFEASSVPYFLEACLLHACLTKSQTSEAQYA